MQEVYQFDLKPTKTGVTIKNSKYMYKYIYHARLISGYNLAMAITMPLCYKLWNVYTADILLSTSIILTVKLGAG